MTAIFMKGVVDVDLERGKTVAGVLGREEHVMMVFWGHERKLSMTSKLRLSFNFAKDLL